MSDEHMSPEEAAAAVRAAEVALNEACVLAAADLVLAQARLRGDLPWSD